jgi:hypothetical protein
MNYIPAGIARFLPYLPFLFLLGLNHPAKEKYKLRK